MDIEELRKHVTVKEVESGGFGQVVVWFFLAAALVCSLATAFVAHPAWPAAGALLLLGLGLLGDRVLQRRNFDCPPVTKLAPSTHDQSGTSNTGQTEAPAASLVAGEMQPVPASLTKAAGGRRDPSIPGGNSIPVIAAVSPVNSVSQRSWAGSGQAKQSIVLPVSSSGGRPTPGRDAGGRAARRLRTVNS